MMKHLKLFENFQGIKTEKRKSMGGDNEYRITYNGDQGYLDYGEENGAYWLEMVEVNPEHRKKGIATKLLDHFFSIVNGEQGYLDMTEFLEDGEKYLKNIIESLKAKYKNIEYA